MKKIVYGKIERVMQGTNNSVRFPKKFSLGKKQIKGINHHFNDFAEGERIKITIENVSKKEFVKAVYGEKE